MLRVFTGFIGMPESVGIFLLAGKVGAPDSGHPVAGPVALFQSPFHEQIHPACRTYF